MIFEISANAAQLAEFIQVFGQRFLGLIDNSNTVYMTYRVPAPEAPYPQDYIIDQQGYVRYWSDEYDPREIIRIIDGLLNVGTKEQNKKTGAGYKALSVFPNPFSTKTDIRYFIQGSRCSAMKIFDATGRIVKLFDLGSCILDRESVITWHGDDNNGNDLPAGIYLLRIDSGDCIENEQIIYIKK